MYDIILQNNATKQFYLLQELENISQTELYLEFEEVEIDAPDGEYTYVVLFNSRNDVVYDFKTPVLDSIVTIDGKDYILKDLCPYTGLLRIGDIEETNKYDENKHNNTIYYEG